MGGPGRDHGRRPVRGAMRLPALALMWRVWPVTGSDRFPAADRDAQEVCGQPEYSAVIRLS